MCGWRRRDTGETEEDGEGEEALDARSSPCMHSHTHCLLAYLGKRVGHGRGRRHRGRAKRVRVVEAARHGVVMLGVLGLGVLGPRRPWLLCRVGWVKGWCGSEAEAPKITMPKAQMRKQTTKASAICWSHHSTLCCVPRGLWRRQPRRNRQKEQKLKRPGLDTHSQQQ